MSRMRGSRRRDKSSFYVRGFTTFALTAVSFLIAVSGLALYVTPRGRVAHWTNWTLAGLEKEQWASLHMTAAALFILVVVLHLFFNWKVLLGYLRLRRVPGLRLKRELAAATLLGVLLVFGTLAGAPPLGSILELRDGLKDYWERTHTPAPLRHAERLRLDELAHPLVLPVEEVVTALEGGGLEGVETFQPVAATAEGDDRAPSDQTIGYRRFVSHSLDVRSGAGRGMGRMNLGEFCSSQGVSLDRLMASLKVRGVSADTSTSLRQIATSLDMRPGQMASWLAGQAGGIAMGNDRDLCQVPPRRSQPRGAAK